jgi:hypothetical protein
MSLPRFKALQNGAALLRNGCADSILVGVGGDCVLYWPQRSSLEIVVGVACRSMVVSGCYTFVVVAAGRSFGIIGGLKKEFRAWNYLVRRVGNITGH